MMQTGVITALGVLFILLFCIRMVNQYSRGVVLRLGKFSRVLTPGLNFVIPWIDRIRFVDMRTVTSRVPDIDAITRDSVPVKLVVAVWNAVVDAPAALLNVNDRELAVVQVAITSLRSVIGQQDLDRVLHSQGEIVQTLRAMIDEATEPWGVKVSRVEILSITIPESMQKVMALEAEAQREKRARIIKAEGELEASRKLAEAARIIGATPAALELRRFQMIQEIGQENNSTTVILMPTDFGDMARNTALATALNEHKPLVDRTREDESPASS
ncbi:SPFH domain-containing protein [Ferrovum sp.]|uniref:SPFH domain-containing protein n=1 Tax=Ferrovum sp. TaxID=2609467 RepID=UPI00262F2A6D|nr:SPFH domain-containing protein [Ferrovum sp.]